MCGRIIHVPVLTAKHASGPAASLTRFVAKLLLVTIAVVSWVDAGVHFLREERRSDKTGGRASGEEANFIP